LSGLALTSRAPVLGWGAFYLLALAAWAGVFWLGADDAGSALARCFAAPLSAGFPRLVAMWALMSLAMMLPTAFPALSRFAVLVQNRRDGLATASFTAFLAAYLCIWLGFALIAATAQLALAEQGWLLPDGGIANRWIIVGLLALAGLYQFSRLKHACLTRCRHPMTFFMAHWQDGIGGAFRMGLKHGADCLGCCWALMLLGFIGGAMSLGWMSLAMILVFAEKLAGPGRVVTLALGLILVSAAGFVLGSVLQT
jgi:predicted metal-binding membrane protein